MDEPFEALNEPVDPEAELGAEHSSSLVRWIGWGAVGLSYSLLILQGESTDVADTVAQKLDYIAEAISQWLPTETNWLN